MSRPRAWTVTLPTLWSTSIMKELGHEMGTTFIVAAHDPRMAQRCDRVISRLIDGQLAPQATTTEAISLGS